MIIIETLAIAMITTIIFLHLTTLHKENMTIVN